MDNFKAYIENNIFEMANITKTYHNIQNIKLNIRQPGDKKYSHDISIKAFKKDNINDSLIIGINRNENTLSIYRESSDIRKAEKKKILAFILRNINNFINLWDSQTLSLEELDWNN